MWALGCWLLRCQNVPVLWIALLPNTGSSEAGLLRQWGMEGEVASMLCAEAALSTDLPNIDSKGTVHLLAWRRV